MKDRQETRERLMELLERKKVHGTKAPVAAKAWVKAADWIEQAGAAGLDSPAGRLFERESREAGADSCLALMELLGWMASAGEPRKDAWDRQHAKALRWACRQRMLPMARLLASMAGAWGEKSAALEACAKDGWAEGARGLADLLPGRVDAALFEGAVSGQEAAVAVLAPKASAEGIIRALSRAGWLARGECCAIMAPLARRQDCEAALLTAARSGKAASVVALARWAAPLENASAALSAAAADGCAQAVEALIPISDPLAENSEALARAARAGCARCVELLLPVSDPRADGCKALRAAARAGKVESAAALLASSDVNARGPRGETPLHAAAAWWGGGEVIDLLIEAGALLLEDDDGRTPLQTAMHYGLRGARVRLLAAMARQEAKELEAQSLAVPAKGRGNAL